MTGRSIVARAIIPKAPLGEFGYLGEISIWGMRYRVEVHSAGAPGVEVVLFTDAGPAEPLEVERVAGALAEPDSG